MKTSWLFDLRLAARRALKRPQLSAIIVLCLAMGLGSTAAVLSVLYPVLLAPLPFSEADELVRVSAYRLARTDPDQNYWIPPLSFERLADTPEIFSALAGFVHVDLDLDFEAGSEPVRVAGARTWGYSFRALGLTPLLGREISTDDQWDERKVALISSRFWHRHFAAAPTVLDRSIRLGGEVYTIIGVVPDTSYPGRTEVWVPLYRSDLTEREWVSFGSIDTIARRAPGIGPAQVSAGLESVLVGLREIHPSTYSDKGLEARDLRRHLVGDFETPLRALLVCAFFVLAIAVANVLNLQVVRAQREILDRKIRQALGANRRQLVHAAMAEAIVLSGVAAIAALAVAHFGTAALVVLAPVDDPAFDRVGLSAPVAAILGFLWIAVVVILTLPPLLVTGGAGDSVASFHRGRTDGRRERRLRNTFVAGQLAVSLVLLVGAGLLAISLDRQRDVDLGLAADRFAALRVATPPDRAETREGRTQFLEQVLDEVRAVPGVEAAGATHLLPMDDSDWGYNLSVEGHPPDSLDEAEMAIGRVVTPQFFRAAGIELVRGRDFERRDRDGAPSVAIVSRAFEKHYWPRGSAVGKRLKGGAYGSDRPWKEIVGVVDDILSAGPSQGARPAVYYPMAQISSRYVEVMSVVARTPGEPAGILPGLRGAISKVDRTATVFRPTTGRQTVEKILAGPRFNALVLMLFAAIGLVLAAAGVYGVTAENLARRQRELAIRMAIGARRFKVLFRVLAGALALGLIGIAVGGLGSLFGVQYLHEMLFEVSALHLPLFALVAAILVLVVLFSALIPAWRATRIDTAAVLRLE